MSALTHFEKTALSVNFAGEEIPRSEHVIDPEIQKVFYSRLNYQLLSLSKNSQEAHEYDMRVYFSWCRKNGYCGLPAHPLAVRDYVKSEYYRGLSPTTIQRRLTTINSLHNLFDIKPPSKEPEVKAAIKVIFEHSEHRVNQAQPLRLNVLKQIPENIDPENIKDVRDMAITALAHSTLYRRSEVARIKFDSVEFIDSTQGFVMVDKIKSALGDKGEHYGYLSPIAVKWVKKWLEMSGVNDGFLFRSLTKHGTALQKGVTGLTVARSINRMGRKFDPDSCFTGHSTRVGAAQDMAAAGMDMAKAMRAGRWKDHRSYLRYISKLTVMDNGMADLFKMQA